MVVMVMMTNVVMTVVVWLGGSGAAQRKKADCSEQSSAGQFGQRRHEHSPGVIARFFGSTPRCSNVNQRARLWL
jgi:hypothetical protein